VYSCCSICSIHCVEHMESAAAAAAAVTCIHQHTTTVTHIRRAPCRPNNGTPSPSSVLYGNASLDRKSQQRSLRAACTSVLFSSCYSSVRLRRPRRQSPSHFRREKTESVDPRVVSSFHKPSNVDSIAY